MLTNGKHLESILTVGRLAVAKSIAIGCLSNRYTIKILLKSIGPTPYKSTTQEIFFFFLWDNATTYCTIHSMGVCSGPWLMHTVSCQGDTDFQVYILHYRTFHNLLMTDTTWSWFDHWLFSVVFSNLIREIIHPSGNPITDHSRAWGLKDQSISKIRRSEAVWLLNEIWISRKREICNKKRSLSLEITMS